MNNERRWSSKLMFLAAAIGSVVGISNVWKFTYVAGENGGGAFVIVYVAAIAFIALPALIAEFLVGRRGGASIVKTMDVLASSDGISPLWRWYGVMGALGAFIALSFYAVVAGWTVDYFYQSLVHGFSGISAEQSSQALGELLGNPGRMLVGHSLFLLLTVATVAGGVRHGLERALRYLTPTLFVILLSLLVFSFFTGDIKAGAAFLFVPDFAKLDMQTVLMAVGQAFFSLGIGLGVLLTIGAYMDKSTSIVRASIVVAAADALVALIAGLAIFPIVFAHNLSPAEGPGLIFATLPVAFGQMPAGAWLGPAVLHPDGRCSAHVGDHDPRNRCRCRRGLQWPVAAQHLDHGRTVVVDCGTRHGIVVQRPCGLSAAGLPARVCRPYDLRLARLRRFQLHDACRRNAHCRTRGMGVGKTKNAGRAWCR